VVITLAHVPSLFNEPRNRSRNTLQSTHKIDKRYPGQRERLINKKNETAALVASTRIAQRIVVIRSHKVMIDADLAALYGVPTKRLNQQVKRNKKRFPEDFVLQLSRAERDEVVANCDHLQRLKFAPTLPYAFTEHGALMAASVLNTARAVEVSLYVVRAFVQLREALATHKDLTRRLDALEAQYDHQFKVVFDAIRELMTPLEPSKKRRIGFIQEE